MASLILKYKIWNKSNIEVINYKDKKYIKQKMTIEKSGQLSRCNDKIILTKKKNNGNSFNSSNDTNYMKDSQMIELVSVEKNDTNYVINCGEWAKDLTQLIDQNAVYFLYKGLTIENFLKEKQKYYVLSQGDIIKLGKIYLKILHIKLNSRIDEDDKDKDDNEGRKVLISDSDSNNDNYRDNKIENNNDNKKLKRNLSFDTKNINNRAKIKNENERNNNILNKSINKILLTEFKLGKMRKESINRKRSRSLILKKNKKLLKKFDLFKLKRSNKNLKHFKWEDKIIKTNIDKEQLKTKNNEIDTSNLLTKKQKGKICRICFSEEDDPIKNPLICPCICKGSMKYIHYNCLKNWLNLKIESDLGYEINSDDEQPTITYNTKDISCELCKEKLPDYIKHKKKIYNVSFYKPKYSKFIVMESIRDDNRRSKFIHIIPLNKKQIIKIGRLNSCDLSLPDFSISRVHCCMYIESGQLFLENNSKYGTKILVQNPNLVMSPQYPLCIEVQNTYLKFKIEKPFSLFSCCNVYTTSMTKMLVYQKQNEKGFDLFCSMTFKEDDGEEEEEDDDNDEDNYKNVDVKEDIKKRENNNKIEIQKIIENTDELKNKDEDEDIKINNKSYDKGCNNKKSILKNKDIINKDSKKEVIIQENKKKENGEKDNNNKKYINKEEQCNKNKELNNSDLKTKERRKSVKNNEEKNKNNENKRKEHNKQNTINKQNEKKNDIIIKKDETNTINDKKSENSINIFKISGKKEKREKNIEKVEIDKTEMKKEEKNKNSNKNIINNIESDINKSNSENESKKEKKKLGGSYNNDLNSNNSKRKVPIKIKSINLDAINDLSYKQGTDIIDSKNSAFDNYQNIFGLIPNRQNQSSVLLAPKHTKNVDLKNFDLSNDSNKITKKYIFQYEESKRNKDS